MHPNEQTALKTPCPRHDLSPPVRSPFVSGMQVATGSYGFADPRAPAQVIRGEIRWTEAGKAAPHLLVLDARVTRSTFTCRIHVGRKIGEVEIELPTLE